MTAAAVWDLWVNGTGLLGIVLLSIPILYANNYARAIARLNSLPSDYANDPEMKEIHDEIQRQLKKLETGWTRWKAAALIGGTIFTILSYVLGLIKAMVV